MVNVNEIQNRVSGATGVSVSCLERILKVYQHNERRNSAHLKERPRRKIKPDKR
jgi:hypothetical protein